MSTAIQLYYLFNSRIIVPISISLIDLPDPDPISFIKDNTKVGLLYREAILLATILIPHGANYFHKL